MSFLTPLYMLGILAVGLPIFFHLIQRKPRGEMAFSSLMFLQPSPPRLTRRSRLDDLLLLLLRALALALIAAAFARPFMRSLVQMADSAPARRTIILVDDSASMKRPGIWDDAVKEVDKICSDLGPRDRVALARFSEDYEVLVDFENSELPENASKKDLIQKQVKTLKPIWQATKLGQALVAATESLRSDIAKNDLGGDIEPRIVLVTDLQAGADLEALDNYEWNKEIGVDVRHVGLKQDGNAWFQLMQPHEGEVQADRVAIRVFNGENSNKDEFEIGWVDENETVKGQPDTVHVPPGQSRVVSIVQPADSSRLKLTGDGEEFDNIRYVVQPPPLKRQLLYIGSDDEQVKHLYFFLSRVKLDDRTREVQITRKAPDESFALDRRLIPLVIVGPDLTEPCVDRLNRYLETGGHVLGVFSKPELSQTAVEQWRKLTALESLRVAEQEVDDYAILADIDFQHPLFLAFNESRFNDFTKIRTWQHRRLMANHEEAWRVIVRFDNGMPALVERNRGDGTLWMLACGWHPDDSQLALSSKFVPLLAEMFDFGKSARNHSGSYAVGSPIEVDQFDATRVTKPNGEVVDLTSNEAFRKTDEPGIYGFLSGEQTIPAAVNLAITESQTAPLDLGQLEQRGIRLGRLESEDEFKERKRQMRDVELESRQRFWRYLIIGALVLLGLETIIAGRKTVRGV